MAWVCAGSCVAVAYAFPRPGLPVEYLQVPSPSMRQDIKVEFQGGGSKAVYLLDGQSAREDSMADAGGFNPEDRRGPGSDPAWVHTDAFLNIDKIIANNTRLWIYCGNGQSTDLDRERNGFEKLSGAVIEQQVIDANKKFVDAYAAAGGANAHIAFPSGDIHNWTYWGQQLQAMKSDLVGYLEAH